MENLSKRIIITGGGAPGASGIISAIKNNSDNFIFSCDAKKDVIGRQLAHSFFTVPLGTAENYIDALLQNCISNGIKHIIPITTKELGPLSLNKSAFEKAGIKISISSAESIALANDKGELLSYLEEKGLEVPAFKICKTVSDFKEAAIDLGYPQNKFVFKPCISNGSRGFRIVNDRLDKSDHLFNFKPNQTEIDYKEAVQILKSKKFPALVLMEHLPGDEYSVDCFISDGKICFVIPRRRDEMRAGISTKGTIVNDPKIINYCVKILELIPFEGPIGIQLKIDINGQAKLLEINPRLQGTSVACIGAGINIPLLTAANKLDDTNLRLNEGVKWGTKFIRYYSEVYYS